MASLAEHFESKVYLCARWLLALDAVTGCRRGELVTIRRSMLFPADLMIKVEVAADGKKV